MLTTNAADSPLRGILAVVIGCAFLTSGDAVMKGLTDDYPTGQLVFGRSVVVLACIVALAHRIGGLGQLRPRGSRWSHFSRGILSLAGAVVFIFGLRYMPLTDAMAITFAGPLIVTLLAPRFLGEYVGPRRWAAVGVGFLGVLLMFRPGSDAIRWVALLPLFVAVTDALRDVLTRQLTRIDTSLSILASTTVVILVGSAATAAFGWKAMPLADVGWILLSGLVFTVAHVLVIEGFRLAEASLIVPFRYSSIVWGLLLGFVFWGDLPDGWMIAGSTLVIGAGLYILHREAVRRADDSTATTVSPVTVTAKLND